MPPAPEGGTTVAVEGPGVAPGARAAPASSTGRVTGERAAPGGTGPARRTGGIMGHHRSSCTSASTRRILAQGATPGPTQDGAPFRPLREQARPLAPMHRVLADGACTRQRTQTFIRQLVGAERIIPAHLAQAREADRAPAGRIGAQMRANFPAVPSCQRALMIESVFAAPKRQQTLSARRWTLVAHVSRSRRKPACPVVPACLQPLPPPVAPPVRLPRALTMSTRPDDM